MITLASTVKRASCLIWAASPSVLSLFSLLYLSCQSLLSLNLKQLHNLQQSFSKKASIANKGLGLRIRGLELRVQDPGACELRPRAPPPAPQMSIVWSFDIWSGSAALISRWPVLGTFRRERQALLVLYWFCSCWLTGPQHSPISWFSSLCMRKIAGRPGLGWSGLLCNMGGLHFQPCFCRLYNLLQLLKSVLTQMELSFIFCYIAYTCIYESFEW